MKRPRRRIAALPLAIALEGVEDADCDDDRLCRNFECIGGEQTDQNDQDGSNDTSD
ncbi:MAG TPA: hypothetical protein VMG12_39050 [Polyangiaceae bacterium]|nr:hypothetical protein [Polyangiaceae bacterium]